MSSELYFAVLGGLLVIYIRLNDGGSDLEFLKNEPREKDRSEIT